MLTRTGARTLAVGISMAMAGLGVGLGAGPAGATTPPALVGATITPSTVNVTSASATVNVLVHATSPSGIEEIDVELDSPGYDSGTGSGQAIYQTFYSGGNLPAPSGSVTDGTWTLPLVVPVGAAAGTWTLGSVGVSDVDNWASYTAYPDNVGANTALIPGTVPTVQVNDTAPDTTGPVLASSSLTPTSVDVSSQPGQIDVDLRVTDPAGAQWVAFDLMGPGGVYAEGEYPYESGSTPTDDHWLTTIDVPQNAESGTWSITNVRMSDALGNSSTATPSPNTFTVSGGTPAVPDAPTDVTSSLYGGGDVAVNWTVSNSNGSPVSSYAVEYSTNSGGSWSTPVNVPTATSFYPSYEYSGLAAGTYIFRIQATNHLGQSAWSTASAPLVVTAPDVQSPVLTGVTASPLAVDVSSASQPLTVSVTATDDTSVAGAYVELAAPGGHQYASGHVYGAPASGSASNGTWNVPVTMPKGAAAGTWTIVYVEVDDTSDNSSTYGPYGDLSFPSAVPTIAVTDSSPDSTAPSIGTASVSPNPVDVTGGTTGVTVSVPVTDAGSGVSEVDMWLVSPTGSSQFNWTVSPHLTSGDSSNGTWSGTVQVPHNVANGSWHVAFEAYDLLGNDTGEVDPPSGVFSVTGGVPTAPGVPGWVDASQDGPGALDVEWDTPYDGGSAITGYTLETSTDGGADWSVVNPGPGTSTFITLSGLDSTVTYRFRVAATNGTGTGAWSSASSPISPSAVSAPATPTGLVATPSNGAVALAWNAVGAATSYDVQWSSDGTTWASLAPAPTTNAATVTGLSNGTGYQFQVRAVNGGGASAWSSSALATPAAVPDAPTGVTATRADQSAVLSWTVPGGSPTGFTVQQSADGGTTWAAATTSAALDGSATGATVTGLSNGQTYVFRVRAVNAAGPSLPSSPSSPVTPAGVPAASSAPSATPGDGSAALSWTLGSANGAPLTAVVVRQSSDSGATWSTAATLGGTATSTTVTGLANGTAYVFQVIETNAVGSTSSPSSAAVTPSAPSAPSGGGGGTAAPPSPAGVATPVILGTAKAGKSVSVSVSLPAGVTVTYKWVLTVKKGSKKTTKTVGAGAALKLKSAWKKGKLQLVVTFSAAGQPSSVRTILVSAKLK